MYHDQRVINLRPEMVESTCTPRRQKIEKSGFLKTTRLPAMIILKPTIIELCLPPVLFNNISLNSKCNLMQSTTPIHTLRTIWSFGFEPDYVTTVDEQFIYILFGASILKFLLRNNLADILVTQMTTTFAIEHRNVSSSTEDYVLSKQLTKHDGHLFLATQGHDLCTSSPCKRINKRRLKFSVIHIHNCFEFWV